MNLFLNTTRPDVKTIRDFTDQDRIALPAVKVSIQAVTLQMAAEQAFGDGKHNKLDRLTVSMSHPDGTAAMLSGRSEITAHFSAPPFQYQQLEDKRGPQGARLATTCSAAPPPSTARVRPPKFRDENPHSYKAAFDALDEATDSSTATRTAADAIASTSRGEIEAVARVPVEDARTTRRCTSR